MNRATIRRLYNLAEVLVEGPIAFTTETRLDADASQLHVVAFRGPLSIVLPHATHL